MKSIRHYENRSDAGMNAVAASIKDFDFHRRFVGDEDALIVMGPVRSLAAVKLSSTERSRWEQIGADEKRGVGFGSADSTFARPPP